MKICRVVQGREARWVAPTAVSALLRAAGEADISLQVSDGEVIMMGSVTRLLGNLLRHGEVHARQIVIDGEVVGEVHVVYNPIEVIHG